MTFTDTFKPTELTAIVKLAEAVEQFNETAPGLCSLIAAVEFERDGRVVARLEIGSGDAANDSRVGHLVFEPIPEDS